MGSQADWDPRAEDVTRDQIRAYDDLRDRCPVAHSELLGWSLLTHRDAQSALSDPAAFSSRVSSHVAVPNGMDPPEHTAFRAVVDRCFTPDLVAAFEPTLRTLATELLAGAGAEIEVMAQIAQPYAAHAQCAYLGWSAEVATSLQQWAAESARATRSRDRAELDRIAHRFDRIIVEQLQRAREPGAEHTVTSRLLGQTVAGRPLTDDEMVSILRNWTAGELGTIAAAVGIVIEFLARHPEVQELVRAEPGVRQRAMDEILRLEAPLIANRRRTTRTVDLPSRTVPAQVPVTIIWPAVQRDPHVFAAATEFRLDRDPADNLLYGRGLHFCPGEGLSRLELGVLLDEFLAAVPQFAAAGAPLRATYPSGGFTQVRVAPLGGPAPDVATEPESDLDVNRAR
jgi:hypothetical protein